jgi:hypothetical protein
MDQIIAGRFGTKIDADRAAASLKKFIEPDDICIFQNNAPGQHATYPIGGDEYADPGARGAGSTAAAAAGAGLAAGAVGALGGPAVALAAAAAGAYSGSFAGAVDKLGDDAHQTQEPMRRPAGVILAARIADPALEQKAIDALRDKGAADIERAKGKWKEGDWTDFDPVAKPHLVDPSD